LELLGVDRLELSLGSSRNDIASNVAVLIAAAGVWLAGSGWPDLLVGSLLAALFLWSALRIFRGASVQ
jgi:Co/Zn/Cd efflux system component